MQAQTERKTMMKYKGIIFDLDGTLLNTVYDLADSVNEVMGQMGFPGHAEDEYKLKIGHGFRNLIEVSLPEDQRTEENIEKGLALFLDTYDQKYKNRTVPYDGIPQLLEELHKRGICFAVNSNKRTDYTNALVKKFFSHLPFTAVFGERKDVPKKPDPASALEIAQMMKLDPKEVVYIGDSKTDMITGKNAGMDTIGVTWGFRDRTELETNGGTYVVDRPEEILEII